MTSGGERSADGNRAPTGVRRRRDKEGTIKDLLGAARRLLRRDGVLAGLNLREVADEAGVNRGLIYQYFGSRQELLRAALTDIAWLRADVFEKGRQLPFVARRVSVFTEAVKHMEFIKLEALLVLDGDHDLRLFPQLDRSRRDLERDQTTGGLDPDADAIVTHVLTAATYLGYCVFRENLARETGIEAEELDKRAVAAFERMMVGLSGRARASEELSGPQVIQSSGRGMDMGHEDDSYNLASDT